MKQLKVFFLILLIAAGNCQNNHGDITVGDPDNKVAVSSMSFILKPGNNQSDWTIDIPSAWFWLCDEPSLYVSSIKLLDGSSILDAERIRFGMREFTVNGNTFELNGNLLNIKGAF